MSEMRFISREGVLDLISESGISGSIQGHIHPQDDADDVWVVQHNLGAEPQIVNVYDADRNLLDSDPFHVSLNQLEIHHNVPRAGRVECIRIDQ